MTQLPPDYDNWRSDDGYDDADDYYPESDDWWFDSPPANIEMQPNIAIICPEEQP